jgi:NADPH:quinone reductase-like Zn-dependent oxidoreductase
MMRRGTPFYVRLFIGLTKPKHPISGTGFSGPIESIGKDVKKLKEGGEFFGESTFGACTDAEYLCVSEDGILSSRPDHLAHEKVASICDGR